MEFEASLEALAEKAKRHGELLETEEAAKTALVLPFLQSLGYDVFNPNEVVPEFTCDVGIKKGEKVDYAIRIDGNITMLIECKPSSQELSIKHASQLYRYFGVTDAKFAILTNGAQYKFYTDLDSSNRMDEKPFFEFDLHRLQKSDFRNLSKFHRTDFDVEAIVETAASLQMEGLVIKALRNEMSEPSDEFVRLIAGQITDKRLTPGTKTAVARHIPNAFRSILRAQLNERISSAMDEGLDDDPPSTSEIETTPDEIEGYQIVRAIAAEFVSVERIVIRDSKSYCAILLDDNNRKPIARLWFNSPTARYIGTFDADKTETRQPIEAITDIYKYRGQIVTRLKAMLE